MSRQLFSGHEFLNPALLFKGGTAAVGGVIGGAVGTAVLPGPGTFVGKCSGGAMGTHVGEKILGKEDLGEGIARMKLKK